MKLLNLHLCQHRSSTNHCNILSKLTNEPALSVVDSSDCSLCFTEAPQGSINRFTICQSLKRILDSDKFEGRKHNKLVMTVKSILGPGTLLHQQIHFLASQKCNCGPRIMIMNEIGPFNCQKDFENILQWLKDATIAGGFTFVDLAARAFITSAINESIELYTNYDLLQVLDL